MSKRKTTTDGAQMYRDHGTATVNLAERPDEAWKASQPGLDVIGTGESTAQATEDMAGGTAERKEAGEL